jgi:hypothetical protein
MYRAFESGIKSSNMAVTRVVLGLLTLLAPSIKAMYQCLRSSDEYDIQRNCLSGCPVQYDDSGDEISELHHLRTPEQFPRCEDAGDRCRLGFMYGRKSSRREKKMLTVLFLDRQPALCILVVCL